jgi:cyclophilin family peptidyl-prolyl cis-trans isomerase
MEVAMAKEKTNLSVSKRREEMQRKKAAQRKRRNAVLSGLLAIVIIAAAVYYFTRPAPGAEPAVSDGGERPLADVAPADRNDYYSQYPPMVIDTAKSYEAIISVQAKGDMRLTLFDDEAPLTVNNFVFLAKEGFYDGLKFHRVIEDFMAQGGDPTGFGSGGPGYQFEDEVDSGRSFDKRGLLAMANAGPGTNGSQFFITFVETPWLDGNHTIFGELTEGDDVLSSLTMDPTGQAGDIIEQIVIVEQ